MASVSVKAINTFISSTAIQNIGTSPQTRVDALIDYKGLKEDTAYTLSIYLYRATDDGGYEAIQDVYGKDCMVRNVAFYASSEYTEVEKVSLQLRGPLNATFKLGSVWTGSQGTAYASYPFLIDEQDTLYVHVIFKEQESTIRIDNDLNDTDCQIRYIDVTSQAKALGTYDLANTTINNTLRLNNVPCDTRIRVTSRVTDRQTSSLIYSQTDYFDIDRTLYNGSDSKYDYIEPKINCNLSSYANKDIVVYSSIHVLGGNSPQPIPLENISYIFNTSDILIPDFTLKYTPVIDIYKTDGTKITIPSNNCNMYISSNSLSLKKAIVDNEIVFGQPISSEFSCELYNVTEDLSGSEIKLWLENVETHSKKAMFTGFIDSCTTDFLGTIDGQGSYRKITAYDWFYFHRDDSVVTKVNDSTKTFNITKWFKQTFKQTANTSSFPVHLENFVEGMGFTYIEPESAYVNGDSCPATIPNSVINKLSVITVGQVIKMLCEPMCVFPYIDNSGNMTFTTLDGYRDSQYARQFDPFILYDYNFEKSNSTREEYTTKPIWGVDIFDSENNKKFGSESTPDGYTKYVSSGNLLLSYNMGVEPPETHHGVLVDDNVEIIGYKWSDYLNELSYLPCSVKMIMADFNNIHLGQQFYFRDLMSDIKYSYVMAIEYSGECLCEQTIKCIAKSEGLSNRAIASNSKLNENRISAELSSKIEDVSTDLNNTKTDLTNNYTPKADAIKSDKIRYLATSYDAVTTSDGVWGTWSDTPQKLTSTKKYLWTYHIYTMANGSTKQDANPTLTGVYGDQGPQGVPGSGGKVYSIKSEHQWIADGTKIDNKTVFKSDSNYHKSNGEARCLVEFSGYETFTIMCRSNGESNYDYLVVSTLNAPTVTKTTNVYKSFYGQASATTYTAVTYTGLDINADYFIRLAYIKDSSVDSGEDRAFFYIPEGVGLEEGIGIAESKPLYYVSNSSTYPAKPTSPVTTDTTNHNVWSTKMATVDNTYGYVFTCTQNKYTDNSYSWSDVVIDEASIYSFSEIQQLKDKIILKVDNNGHLVQVQLSADPSTGSQFNVKAETIDFSSEAFTISTDYLRITGSYFKLDATGKITCTGGTIGGWLVDTALHTTGKTGYTDGNVGTYIGTTGIEQYKSADELIRMKDGKFVCVGGSFTVKNNSSTYKLDADGLSLKNSDYSYSLNNEGFSIKITNRKLCTIIGTYDADILNDYEGQFEIYSYKPQYTRPSYYTSITGTGISIGTITGSESSGLAYYPKFTAEYNGCTIETSLDVTGKVTITNNVEINGKLDVVGNATISGDLNANNVGKYVYKNNDWPNLPSTALTKLGYLTLEKGIWVVTGKIQLVNSLGANQRLQVGVGLDTTSTNVLINSVLGSSAGAPNKISATNIINVTESSANVYLYGYQNTGSTQTVSETSTTSTYLRAVRIK